MYHAQTAHIGITSNQFSLAAEIVWGACSSEVKCSYNCKFLHSIQAIILHTQWLQRCSHNSDYWDELKLDAVTDAAGT